MDAAPSSREKILDVAEALFARRGYSGVGLSDQEKLSISDRAVTKITRGSIFFTYDHVVRISHKHKKGTEGLLFNPSAPFFPLEK